MRLIAIGNDQRMSALLAAARREGFDCVHVTNEGAMAQGLQRAEAIVLPWPRGFDGGHVAQTQISREALMRAMPGCAYLMGGGLGAQDFPMAARVIDPSADEAFLMENAALTAEGTMAALLGGGGIAGTTCLITGFGRVGAALAKRLCAFDAFVIVCARSEKQMHLAHDIGAHPVPLSRLPAAIAQAQIIVNTVPARIFGGEALSQMPPSARLIELASPPYGADPELAARRGVTMEIMGGVPGKYAPQRAGEALFRVLLRAMDEATGKGEDA